MNTPNFYLHKRDADFLNHCVRIAKEKPMLDKGAVVVLALENRPLHYYISYDRACTIVRKMINNHPNNPYQTDERRAFAEELTAEVRKAMAQLNCRLPDAVSYVLNCKRPSRFHISFQLGRRIAGQMLQNVTSVKLID